MFHFTSHFDSRSMNISYLDFNIKPAVFCCLTNAIAPPPIALKSCSRVQMDQLVFLTTLEKKFFGPRLQIFSEWCRKWSSFWVILAHVAWPRAQLLGQSVSLKYALETSLESKLFKPLINFLAFLVQKLWSKIN